MFAIMAWLALLVLPTRLPTPGPDPSWQAVLNFAAVHHLQHGTDILFTYGPLGYLMQDSFCPGSWLKIVLFQVFIRLHYVILVGGIAWLAQTFRKASLQQTMVFATTAIWLPAVDADSFYLLIVGFTGLMLIISLSLPAETKADVGLLAGKQAAGIGADATAGILQAQSPGRFKISFLVYELGAVFILGILALLKTTFLVYAAAAVGCILLAALLRRRWVLAVVIPFIFLAGFWMAWVILAQQHSANLAHWLRGSAEMAIAYQQGMAQWPGWGCFSRGILVMLILMCYLLNVCRTSWSSTPAALLLAGGVGLAWKQTFIRGDPYHAATFFIFALVCIALLAAVWGYRLTRPPVVALTLLCLWGSVCPRLVEPFSRFAENVRFLVTVPHLHQIWAAHARKYELPGIRALVGASTIDVRGWEQAIAILNGLNYHPAPVFQPYAAGSPYLAWLNAEFFRSDKAPEFILTRGSTIDDRLPNLDDSISGLVIAQRYKLISSEKEYRLFRRVADESEVLEPIFAGTLGLGEPLPIRGGEWCELVMRETRIGWFARALWASPPVLVLVEHEAKPPGTYRFVPRMGESGFLISDGVRSLTVESSLATKACFRPEIRYRVYSIRGGNAQAK